MKQKPDRLPYIVMSVVIGMYVIKVIAKCSIGKYINSPVITGDGVHNFGDIIQALAIVLGIFFSRFRSSGKYPFGLKSVESLFEFAIGLAILYMGWGILADSIRGLTTVSPAIASLLSLNPAESKKLLLGAKYFPWVVGVTSISALCSYIVGRWQINAGKSTGHPTLIADGKETLCDGRIEVAAFLGVLSEYFFNAPYS